MCYYCTIVCDCCGTENITFLNETVTKAKMERLARLRGWKHESKNGWVCPICQKIMNEENRREEE